MVQRHEVEACIRYRRADMWRAVGVAQGLLQHDAVAGLDLDREGKETVRCEHTGGGSRDRNKIADVDKNVGRDDKMILRARLYLGMEEVLQVEHSQSVVKAFSRAFATIPGDMSTPTSQSA